MRRFGLLLVLAAAVPAASSLAPWLASEPERCAMACHSGGAAAGRPSCCLIGGDPSETAWKACAASRDGVPPAPTCRLFAPLGSIVLAMPGISWRAFAPAPAAPGPPCPEPAEPVPLRLS